MDGTEGGFEGYYVEGGQFGGWGSWWEWMLGLKLGSYGVVFSFSLNHLGN
jgi:hypothetical protein